MRIMFVINGLTPGGAELHALQLVDSFATRGCHCTIVSLKGGDSTLLGRTPAEICHGNRIYDINTLLRLRRLILTHAPQVIVSVEERPLLFATISHRLARSKAKLVSIRHNAYLRTAKEHIFHPLYRQVVGRADAMIYVSHNQRALWEGRGFSPRCSIVIPNGVDTDRFSADSVIQWREQKRSQLGFGPDDFVLGLCGRFRPEKNHCQLIDAIRILRSRGCPAKALFVGGGPTQANVEQHARNNGMLEHVVFAGHQPDVRPYASAFDVGVLCSIYEAAPLALLELMAMGLPVVASKVGGTAEVIQPGENGFLFPVGDTASLVSSVETMMDPLKREAFGRAASNFVAENFAADRMIERYSTFLNEIISERQ